MAARGAARRRAVQRGGARDARQQENAHTKHWQVYISRYQTNTRGYYDRWSAENMRYRHGR